VVIDAWDFFKASYYKSCLAFDARAVFEFTAKYPSRRNDVLVR